MGWYTREWLAQSGIDPDTVCEWHWEGSTLHVRLGVKAEPINISTVPLPPSSGDASPEEIESYRHELRPRRRL